MRRYEPTVDYDMENVFFAGMDIDPDGEWVRYEDAKKVVEALEMLILFNKPTKGNAAALANAYTALNQINGE